MQDNRIPPQKRPMTEAEMLRRRELRRSAIKKQKRRRTLFLTACALAAVLLIAGIVLLCCSCGRSESSPHDESIYGSFAMSDKSCVYTFREDGSGELRLSNFLLWQSAYSEVYFTDTLWPDFTPEKFEEAIEEYQGRNRRFGGR